MCNAVNPNLTSFHSQEIGKQQEHMVMDEEEQKQISKK